MLFFNRYKFPSSLKEAAYNVTTNTGAQLAFVLNFMQVSVANAHGTCFGGKYTCTSEEVCHDAESCETITKLGDQLKEAALTAYNQTQQNTTMSPEERYRDTSIFQNNGNNNPLR